MKVYKITDESESKNTAIAYLSYYEKSRVFSLEISPEIDQSRLPIFFYGFASQGKYSLDTEWSKRWVMERVVPEDRQNLGTILRDNRLKEYDLMKLLLKSGGRCAQDECAVREAEISDLPLWFAERQGRKLNMAIALDSYKVMLCFNDKTVKVIDLSELIRDDRRFKVLENDRELFKEVEVQPGGNGISWKEWLFIPASKLYEESETINISADDIRTIIESGMIDTAGLCEKLGCTRQYADKMVKEGKIRIVGGSGKTRLYLKSEIERLKW